LGVVTSIDLYCVIGEEKTCNPNARKPVIKMHAVRDHPVPIHDHAQTKEKPV